MWLTEDELRYLDLFLKSRKSEKTKEYVKIILDFLGLDVTRKNQGWVQSKDLKDAMVQPDKIPNASSFFNLIEDMETFGLIEKFILPKKEKQRGKPRVYYRNALGNTGLNSIKTMDRGKLESEYEKLHRSFMVVTARFNAAECLLEKCCNKINDSRNIREIVDKKAKLVFQPQSNSAEMIQNMDEVAREYLKTWSLQRYEKEF